MISVFKKLLGVSVLLLGACTNVPDANVDRPHFDDIADADKDGVINQRDYCKNTPLESQVDIKGCSEWHTDNGKKVFNIDFDFDRSEVRNDQRATVLALVSLLSQYPEAIVELIGDTSAEGSSEYNQTLAMRRVSSISVELIRLGVKSQRIEQHIYTEQSALVNQALNHQRLRRTRAILHHQGKNQVNTGWSIYSAQKLLQKSQ
tara:strand:- start:940 stop:1551 length:612 start_codon:yes stop_codon:yes gene_type:complete